MYGPIFVELVLWAASMASAAKLMPSYRCTAPGAVKYVEKLPVLPTFPFSALSAETKAGRKVRPSRRRGCQPRSSSQSGSAYRGRDRLVPVGGDRRRGPDHRDHLAAVELLELGQERRLRGPERLGHDLRRAWPPRWPPPRCGTCSRSGRGSGWRPVSYPAFFMAAIAGATKVWEPMSLPKARATRLYGAAGPWPPSRRTPTGPAGPAIEVREFDVVELRLAGHAERDVLLAPKSGTTEAASSEVQPMTRPRFDVEAYIWRTAGTASAGSPRVSTDLQLSLWPSTPASRVDGVGRRVT